MQTLVKTSEATHIGLNRREIWQWCLRADAVAQCFIRDVFAMKQDSHKNSNFWWLGTVPCRTVKFVGMLVAATAYERRTVYIVDDGTSAIQCIDQHSSPPKKSTESPAAVVTSAFQFPKPEFEVGQTVRVVGRVQSWRETRQIYATEICSCLAREEPEHWISVGRLHQIYYSQPFSIPPLPLRPATPAKPIPALSAHATPSSVSASCIGKWSSSSSVNDAGNSPIRLRHPSRLRSRELIANTFKIYLKNYMDVLSDPSHFPIHDSDDEFSDHETSINESPTKRLSRLYYTNGDAATPKPRRIVSDETPRPLVNKRKARPSAAQPLKGFTLSYLRRVPDLADMACAVVKVERKARIREARKKQKETSQMRIDTKHVPVPAADPTSRITKRLYIWALKELRKEGSIIICEGDSPVWQLPAPHGIWKVSKSSQSMDRSNLTSSTTISTVDEDDSGELSDPPAREESYIPLTPTILTEPVFEAIRNSIMRNNKRRKKGQSLGPTTEEIQTYLSRTDARWEFVGEYTILDTLELLKKKDRVYRAGNGTWGLPI
ncbi:hypothetical protein BU17DRAFT_44247 [Hysterangium stoloniferum]|nr:hypothetical protein BU17DRAFT_44247 [Hysterangium stoloniferum]